MKNTTLPFWELNLNPIDMMPNDTNIVNPNYNTEEHRREYLKDYGKNYYKQNKEKFKTKYYNYEKKSNN